ADCGLSDRAVKGAVAEAESDETAPATRKAKAVRKGAQAARERWLLIERQKGFRTASGPQNLYHGIVPERWIAKLRQLRSGGVSVETDERIVRAADAVTASLNGVKQVHPSPLNGVHQVHPSKPEGVQYVHPSDQRGEPGASKGCITCTLTLNTPKRETPTEEVSSTPQPARPEKTPVSFNGKRTPRAARPAPTLVIDGQPTTIERAFDLVWVAYPAGPNKTARGGAQDTFTEIVTGRHRTRKATAQEILDGARRYAAKRPNPTYVLKPKRWLNEGGWDDGTGAPADPDAEQA